MNRFRRSNDEIFDVSLPDPHFKGRRWRRGKEWEWFRYDTHRLITLANSYYWAIALLSVECLTMSGYEEERNICVISLISQINHCTKNCSAKYEIAITVSIEFKMQL